MDSPGGPPCNFGRPPRPARPATPTWRPAWTLTTSQRSLNDAAQPGPGDFGDIEVTITATRSLGLFAGRIRYNVAGQRFSDDTLGIATQREMLLPPESVSPHPLLALDELDPYP
ncbi:hypothetical protein [Gordonia bronchialis]|uniref:hypothetical protein n=1 Tax=Gordonia bronchialis TaxID=2054 RepID=UPI001CBFF14F|nr:hypothetical protein [Gordonia bronchialis]